MPTTVGQHSVAAFTSPVNGTTPIDANTVRGNDNTTRVAYVNHDADPGIHVQSSSLASRPTAGTAGRKWITVDAGSYKLWYDDGAVWHEVGTATIDVFVYADENLVKGDVVKVTGYQVGSSAPRVAKVASASDVAFGIINSASIANGATGYLTNTGIIQDVNTGSFAIGDILYPNTSGGLTATKPTSGNYQVVAYVLRSNANNGVLYVEFSAPRIVERSDNTASTIVLRDASGNFSAGTITANLTGNISGTAPAGTLTGTTLASNVVTSSLTTVGTIGTGVWQGTAIANAYIATGLDVTKLTTGATLPSNVLASSLTSVGTLSSLTVSGDLTVDTNTLKVDSANNRVGFGTASPSYRADISNGGGSAAALRVLGNDQSNVRFRIENSGSGGRAFELTGGLTGANNSDFTLYDATAAATRLSVDSSGNLAVDTNTLYVDAANNRVGIGTASPGDKFTVVGGSGDGISYTDSTRKVILGTSSGLGGGYIGTTTNDAFLFITNGSEKARLDASGNLGLGVTPSAWDTAVFRTVQVGSGVGSVSLSGRSDGAKDMLLASNVYYGSGNFRYIANGVATQYRTDGGAHAWSSHPSGTAGNALGTATATMTLDASGNLGIGTTDIGTPLTFADTNARKIQFNANAANHYSISKLAGGGTLGDGEYRFTAGNTAAGSFTFSSGGAERARITSGGDFLIGSTSGSHKFGVSVASGADRDIAIFGVTGASNGFRVQWNHANLKTYVSISDIPTSSAGLPAGTLYSDGGTIKIA